MVITNIPAMRWMTPCGYWLNVPGIKTIWGMFMECGCQRPSDQINFWALLTGWRVWQNRNKFAEPFYQDLCWCFHWRPWCKTIVSLRPDILVLPIWFKFDDYFQTSTWLSNTDLVSWPLAVEVLSAHFFGDDSWCVWVFRGGYHQNFPLSSRGQTGTSFGKGSSWQLSYLSG